MLSRVNNKKKSKRKIVETFRFAFVLYTYKYVRLNKKNRDYEKKRKKHAVRLCARYERVLIE